LPRWVYYSNLRDQPKIEWVYETPDVALIHNMLLCAFADEVLAPEAHNSYAYTAKEPQRSAPPSNAVWLQSSASPSEQASILHGTLQKLPVDVLLQSLSASNLTGRVQIRFHAREGIIYFVDGAPVHCELGNDQGEAAMIELLTWRVGDFEVFEDAAAVRRTIKKRMQTLLMESATLMDYRQFLTSAKVDEQTVLVLNSMSHEQFIERTRDAVPVDDELQRSLANHFDGHTSIAAAAAALNLTAVQWTPLIYNMVKCGLVRKLQGVGGDGERDHLLVDKGIVHEIRRSLSNSASGFYSVAGFMYHLQNEYSRYLTHSRPFTLVLMQVKKEPGQKVEVAMLNERIKSLEQVLRPCDLLCHFDHGYAVILPETGRTAADSLMHKVVDCLSHPADPAKSTGGIWVKIGAACVPDDSQSLASLSATALQKERSLVLRLG
ncbi:MAG: DUF4388 domain-containing protein, partial [Cyanobacteria bacterium SZAS LIN-2]|nr:DUF4388 domain-containing protein [Cyanobacteria bacterium SZAS LIN-2]